MRLRVAKKIVLLVGPVWEPRVQRWNDRTLIRALQREVAHLRRLRRLFRGRADHRGRTIGGLQACSGKPPEEKAVAHTGPVKDGEEIFGEWRLDDRHCERPECEAKVAARPWKDGAFEDWQYRCAAGHEWWVDGIDS